MTSDTLITRQKIIERKALVDGGSARLKSLDMIGFQIIAKLLDNGPERFDLRCHIDAVLNE